jgi:uncharacterized protein (TIGR02678 family)
MTASVQAQEVAAGRARAIRVLLARPMLDRRAGDDFGLVVQHAPWLQRWFDDKCGWALIVDARHGFARLRKIPAAPSAARGAHTARSTPRPFTRRRYSLFCVAAAVLSDTTRPQISLHDLVDRIRAVTADREGLAAFVPTRREERIALVDAVTALVDLGVLRVVEARGDYAENATGNVLYDIDDRRLGHLIAAPRPPSLAKSFQHMMHEDRYGPWLPSEAVSVPSRQRPDTESPTPTGGPAHSPGLSQTLTAAVVASTNEEQQRRRARHRVMRLLLDDPVLYLDRLLPAERGYLQQTIGSIAGWAAETGMVLERRAEGWLLVDPDDIATDVRFPEGNDLVKFAALILLGALQPAGVPTGTVRHPLGDAEVVIADRLRGNPTWARAYQDESGPARLTRAALKLLTHLDLADVDATGVTLLPPAGRYRPDVTDVIAGPTRTSGRPAARSRSRAYTADTALFDGEGNEWPADPSAGKGTG